jgi:hypothetical protein
VPSFTITTASNNVTLDASGSAQVSFTVTNTTPQPIKGRLLAEAEGSAQSAWLSIVGDPAREFPASGAEQVSVQLAVPPASPSGSYAFRLDAVAEANPDEDFTKGPSVAFQIAPQPVVKKKKFPWWIVIVAVIVLAGIGVIAWLLTKSSSPTTVTVPNVVCLSPANAQTALSGAGLVMAPQGLTAGVVTSESPPANTKTPRGATVTITVGQFSLFCVHLPGGVVKRIPGGAISQG